MLPGEYSVPNSLKVKTRSNTRSCSGIVQYASNLTDNPNCKVRFWDQVTVIYILTSHSCVMADSFKETLLATQKDALPAEQDFLGQKGLYLAKTLPDFKEAIH